MVYESVRFMGPKGMSLALSLLLVQLMVFFLNVHY